MKCHVKSMKFSEDIKFSNFAGRRFKYRIPCLQITNLTHGAMVSKWLIVKSDAIDFHSTTYQPANALC